MSSALVRQALAFVDPEEHETNKNKRSKANRPKYSSNSGQGKSHPYKGKSKSQKKEISQEDTVESNIKKLLALSAPVSKPEVTQKIVERAVKGKPLLEKVEKKVEKEQSILFPEETFKSFEKSYFCS